MYFSMNFFGIASDYSLNLSVMNRFMFGYVIASLSSLLWPNLLSNSWALITLLLAAACVRLAPLLSGCLFSLAWISIFFNQLMTIPTPTSAHEIGVRAEIISLVNQNSDWISMDIRLLDAKYLQHPSQNMRVSWQRPPEVNVGEQWWFALKPKSITSVMNQGGFNGQRYFLNRHIVAKGRVISAKKHQPASGLRQQVLAYAQTVVSPLAQGDLMMALQFGDKSLVNDERWQALRNTGTGHLVSISGLHLTVVAFWSFTLCFALLKSAKPSQGLRNWYIATVLMLCCTAGYAALSGFALPTVRALIMLVCIVVLMIAKRHSQPFERLLWALFLVLLFDPASVLGAGFWLSFAAITIIFSSGYLLPTQTTDSPISAANRGQGKVSGISRLGKIGQAAKNLWAIQWRLTLMMTALQGVLFAGIAPYSLLSNFVLVPYFSLIIIPACFLLLLLTLLAYTLMSLAGVSAIQSLVNGFARLVDLSLSPVAAYYDLVSGFPQVWWSLSQQISAALIFTLIGIIIFVVARAWQWRLTALALQLPLMLASVNNVIAIPKVHWQVHMVDVGQGLSIVVQVDKRAIVYDTGAAFGTFSYAKRALLPFLSARGITKVDYLIISHDDNDHAGGLAELTQAFPHLQLISDSHSQHDSSVLDCRPGKIQWQQLSIEFLLPQQMKSGNNGSCVVLISDAQQSILLTGDIEASSEKRFVALYPELTADVMVVPHHGSLTSSSTEFVQSVSPKLALVPAGYQNRYKLPKFDVIQRYIDTEAEVLVAGIEGQVSVNFNHSGIDVKTYRSDFAPFWYNNLLGFGEMDNSE
ncbi:DNA internalization-related competence protein ComEC/Rec2 [Shewanella waksmanii]|uniref:DNA internalization-related competence protein ComEC/Rec2 n=1 Tax=Shewanella waksmanii TaxID=213783 RepID=UPI0037370909